MVTIVVAGVIFVFVTAIACRCHHVRDVTAYDSGRCEPRQCIREMSTKTHPVLFLHVGGVVPDLQGDMVTSDAVTTWLEWWWSQL